MSDDGSKWDSLPALQEISNHLGDISLAHSSNLDDSSYLDDTSPTDPTEVSPQKDATPTNDLSDVSLEHLTNVNDMSGEVGDVETIIVTDVDDAEETNVTSEC